VRGRLCGALRLGFSGSNELQQMLRCSKRGSEPFRRGKSGCDAHFLSKICSFRRFQVLGDPKLGVERTLSVADPTLPGY
jgi:hypothetical protein